MSIREFMEVRNYIDFSRDSQFIILRGVLNNRELEIKVRWNKGDLSVEASEVKDGSFELFYNKSTLIDGGSPAQKMSLLFHRLNLDIPKNDVLGSGLDLNLMIDSLIKEHGFTITSS